MLPELRDFDALLESSTVLMRDRYGPKVIATPDGGIMKLFRRKRLLSSALWNPYAKRFAKNAARLTQMGIPTVEVTGLWRIPSLKKDAVAYKRLEGESLRDLGKTPELFGKLAAFVSGLHEKGVFFRSIHFGNILEMPDGRLALIDMADLTFKGRPLTPNERLRNFGHLTKYKEDQEPLEAFGVKRFIQLYHQAAGRSGPGSEALGQDFERKLAQPAG
ncbi:hypothetical protein OVA24_03390 [Luteolibacter sp. SL250]|uniref:hypothetical protein n=1 Tax=Luteolibacter sp. SL250 TaxID=2995170 RepID=UPI0022720914|nr:hypothetical protein [Luteolibacter sp. SL250]WAC20421.1 hypothetical protein OVA24_03390 [Luteolibacter sp. SL250]